MDVVYFFCESKNIRIPFYFYDRPLFDKFVSLGGVWDKARNEFNFSRTVNSEHFSNNLQGIPFVWVDERSPIQLRVAGFLELPWEKDSVSSDEHSFGKPPDTEPIPLFYPEAYSTVFRQPPLPEYFPEYWRNKLEIELRSAKYSPKTMLSYVYYNRLLCGTLQKAPEQIQPDDIKYFLAVVEKDRKYSASSMNLSISAIKFFYKNVLRREITQEKLRPRHDKNLPMVMDKDEIQKLLSVVKNIKHRLLLMLVYSSGLRVSEAVALKKEHIDISRLMIHVRLGKGRKDRCTILSQKAALCIIEYCKTENIQNWLFPGQTSTRHLTIRAAQHIFDNALRHAEISKKASIHSLRHTFATHLLESGTDVRYIQALLGHSSLRTTERYTHIARRNILSIQSPLDTIQ